MPEYCLYFLDRNEHIRRRIDLDCRDDDHAIEVVGQHAGGSMMELWQGERVVKAFPAEPA